MSLFGGFAIYFIIWWLTLFVLLPLGNRSQAEEGHVEPGTEPSAPVNSRLPLKLVLNTVLAGLVFGVFYAVTVLYGFDADSIPSIFPQDR